MLHSLELMELELTLPSHGYPAADPGNGLFLYKHAGRNYIHNSRNGHAEWCDFRENPDMLRLVMNPDEGGPLFAAFQFLAQNGFPVSLRRDELRLAHRCYVEVNTYTCHLNLHFAISQAQVEHALPAQPPSYERPETPLVPQVSFLRVSAQMHGACVRHVCSHELVDEGTQVSLEHQQNRSHVARGLRAVPELSFLAPDEAS